jgi:hypothetical protein
MKEIQPSLFGFFNPCSFSLLLYAALLINCIYLFNRINTNVILKPIVSRLLALKYVPERHTGVYLSSVVTNIVSQWDIVSQ